MQSNTFIFFQRQLPFLKEGTQQACEEWRTLAQSQVMPREGALAQTVDRMVRGEEKERGKGSEDLDSCRLHPLWT